MLKGHCLNGKYVIVPHGTIYLTVVTIGLEAETLVSNSTQYKLFIGDDKKYMLFGMTFSFKTKFRFRRAEVKYDDDVWISTPGIPIIALPYYMFIRDLTHIRRRRGRRLVKNVFLIYFGILPPFGSIVCVCLY